MPRATSNMPPGLRAYWRKKNGAKRARKAASRSTRRATKARRVYSKRTHMPRKKSGSRRSKKQSWLDLAITTNTAVQLAEPLIEKNVHGHLIAGDVPAAIASGREALHEVVSPENLAQVAVPAVLGRFAKKMLAKVTGSRKLMGRRIA